VNKTERERSKPSVENEHFETRKLYAYINKKVDLIYRNSLIATESQPTAIESEVDVVMLAYSRTSASKLAETSRESGD